ncbi:MAG TPA: transcriptional regulator GcvA, partial [Kiloniellales bacterium]|nr:transcriptional regulator GcvA [Kiloniellales bacterium]
MSRRLPSLNALRAFEAGARHLSFTRAAQELHVTQTAISHQVRQLEEELGFQLFLRSTRRLELTPEGQRLAPVLTLALDRIGEAVAALRARKRDNHLRVSMAPAFGAKWLVGRLSRFWLAHPEVELELHHSPVLADFATDDVDLAVRYGRGPWTGLTSELLFRLEKVPVCSPRLLEGDHPLHRPEDLAHHVLLHESDHGFWLQWAASVGLEEVDVRRGPLIDDVSVLTQLAINGEGVALGSPWLLAEDLEAGRLVMPFAQQLEHPEGYHLVYPPGALEQPA